MQLSAAFRSAHAVERAAELLGEKRPGDVVIAHVRRENKRRAAAAAQLAECLDPIEPPRHVPLAAARSRRVRYHPGKFPENRPGAHNPSDSRSVRTQDG